MTTTFVSHDNVQALITARKMKGYSLQSLAEYSGMSLEQLIAVESGHVLLTEKDFLQLVQTLGWKASNFNYTRRESS